MLRFSCDDTLSHGSGAQQLTYAYQGLDQRLTGVRGNVVEKSTRKLSGDASMGILVVLLIGLVAGWLAGQIMDGGGYGVIGDLIVGVLGALLWWVDFWNAGHLCRGIIGVCLVATLRGRHLPCRPESVKRRGKLNWNRSDKSFEQKLLSQLQTKK